MWSLLLRLLLLVAGWQDRSHCQIGGCDWAAAVAAEFGVRT
jgi:hypothetical protein